MIHIEDKKNCCGCSACSQICPTRAINMEVDGEGFLYPNVNKDICIGCDRCVKVCPMQNKNEVSVEHLVYVIQNKNEEVRKESTSGGAFTAIASYVLDRKGIVFGAGFDENFGVLHKYTETYEGLEEFRGSKYIQSNLRNTFRMVKKFLDDNRWVLFTGTPCQVEGLHNYLGRKYDKLILMDIVCYAISSPKVWQLYLSHLNATGLIDISNVKKIKFRDKTHYGYEYTLMAFYDADGKEMYSSGPESNQMLRSFVSNTSTRPSCYNCPVKKTDRISDITVWDCYNICQYDKSLDDNKGTSHILIQSRKGKRVFEEINAKLKSREVDYQKAIDSEPAIRECATASEKRTDFFKYVKMNKDPFNDFFKVDIRVKAERLFRIILSKLNIYSTIKRMLSR